MRLNLELNDAQMKSFRALQTKTGAGTMKDLVNHALTMLEWGVKETENGNEVAAINEKTSTFRVLVTPLLQHVARVRDANIRHDINAQEEVLIEA